ncbi:efflux RND transporter periplasmic adaptor subunit [Flavobacterium sp. CYK-4]|uniref:efflux RND transporter periplasmic adaptor subunit n=1 Tax=Flavobacterium lotistagni TaxID=2709660 RepID=UPI0014078579|nr:efflux RND transporter periplasmic adaptor subunit [Flavobacterium lotistagni]NHM07232.1 efflux RND transporter periplasmic adaptor subunit [Flavobacterium lotistagni]
MKNTSIFLFILLTLFGCQSKQENAAQKTETRTENTVNLTDAQLSNIDLQIGQLQKKALSSTLKLSGQIDVPPQNIVSVSMPLGGYLKATRLLPGMPVRKGEIIATMEDQQYIQLQQEYLMTKSKLFYAEKEFERQRELNASQASSDKVYQMADAEYQTLRITLNALSEKLRLIHINPAALSEKTISKSVNIYSPINGFVSKVDVNIGKYVNPADVLFELINPSDIHLNLKVFEKDVMQLAIGQQLMAYTNNNPQKKYPCEIILISKDISAQEHSAEVHSHFEKYDKILLPGMYMNAIVETKQQQVLALPKEAVLDFEGKSYVFVSQNKHQYKMVEVSTGITENGFVAIIDTENLQGQNIVIKEAYTLLMKLKNKADE